MANRSKVIENILDRLKDSLNTPLAKTNTYQEVQNYLRCDASVSLDQMQELLAICIRDLKEDIQFAANALTVISAVLAKQKTEQCPSKLDLEPSAIAILNFLKYIVQSSISSALEDMCFEVIQSYPDDTLIALASSHSTKLIDIIRLYCQHNSVKRKRLAFDFLHQILKTLPLSNREVFAKDGLNTWFKDIVPTVVKFSVESVFSIFLEVVDILADSLANIDYTENPHWKNVLEHIYTPEKYPFVMKKLLEQGNSTWHRLWIVFIKLLKNQITKVINTSGSPINAMLPVVELAFKMDTVNRCRAFECWNVLIDNFSSELNEAYVIKRIKLLIIPLRLNNAKDEQTVLAKLDTWWHLITKFHTKIDKFTDFVFVPFLHFCFGKQHATGKASLTPGQYSDKVKRQCVQSLVEIVGHVNCEGCVTIPKLKSRLISTKVLVDYWTDWIYALKSAIAMLAYCENELPMQQARCLWQGVVMTVGELPENNVRKDLFNSILAIIEQLLEKRDPKITDLVFNVLICSLFSEQSTKQLLKVKDVDKTKEPLHIILTCLLKPLMANFYSRQETKDLVRKLKPIATFIIEEAPSYPEQVIESILNDMTPNDNSLMLWSALAEALCESKYDLTAPRICEMLMWPLTSWKAFSNEKCAQVWYNWYSLYNLIHPKLWKKIDSKIINLMTPPNLHFIPSNIFHLIVAVAVLKHKLSEKNDDFGKEAEILLNTLSNVEELKQIEEGIPILIDTLVLMLNVLTESVSVCTAKKTLTAVKNLMILIFMTKGLKTPDAVRPSKFIMFIENLLQPIPALLKVECYSMLPEEIADHMITFSRHLNEEYFKPLKKTITSILKTILLTSQEGSNLYVKTKAAIDAIENDKQTSSNEDKQNKFPVPEAKGTKKSKKREANIVNTVVENGEEYVVVKSNWKFNPRKLTENQKEKLKRKREDIPALYQDLSQSQDEFKLATWKTDSCDVSTTTSSRSNSKSANEDVSTILKNIPSSDVVPTIMEKIFSENTDLKIVEESTKIQASPALKDPKTPRLALKDRVFRNVRNLMEKSGKQTDVKLISEDLNQTIDDSAKKSPSTKAKYIVNLVNSAPPKINSERPSRVIKKPKKFDDAEVFAIKKRRRSQNDSQPDIEPDTSVKEITTDDLQCSVNYELSKPVLISRETTINETQNVECPEQTSTETCNNEVIDLLENTEISQPIEEDNEILTDNVKCSGIKDGYKCIELKKRDMCSGDNASRDDKDKPITDSSDSCPLQETSTPKLSKSQESDAPKSSIKKKRSRIEKQLLIDMVEGHPFLQVQSEKRVTRKNIFSPVNKRTSLAEKFNKSKLDTSTKTDKKSKEKDGKDRNAIEKTSPSTISVPDSATVLESRISDSSDDLPMSEDVIESSQDSTITTISVKSTKSTVKKMPIIVLEKTRRHSFSKNLDNTQSLLNEFNNDVVPLTRPLYQDSKDDIELPENKMVPEDKTEMDLTENMDTEPLETKDSSSDVIIISNEVVSPIVLNTENTETVSDETQEIADADTQPMDIDSQTVNIVNQKESNNSVTQEKHVMNDASIITIDSQEDAKRETMDFSDAENAESTNICSPFKDDVQRNKDFLNDTIEISPIKTLSPVRDNKSPSPETSSDYVVIKLASPVQSNGEPYDKCDSPEVFTEDKVSPDKRDQSPPRAEVVINESSPSSSLSLKKNRPQVRSTCRGAQMLSLCAPDKLQAIMNSERSAELDEPKKSSNIPVRRNLKILYSSVAENSEKCDESETSENFLKFKKALPTADCSPSGPILKRKLVDIADEATISPASKRKRVSFHDPPVSTTIAVQKYIEPGVVRSPQSSAQKRMERQMRSHANMKSPKRLDTAFKLENILNKAVESFSGDTSAVSEDIAMSSLDQTPAVEIIKTSDLNDTDPICSELLNCNDPIDNIAGELSSPNMKALLIKEWTGKVETIADLAKMTELEVNRLCIKAPKVQVAKKVLTEYASKKAKTQEQSAEVVEPSSGKVETIADLAKMTELEVNRLYINAPKVQVAKKVLTDYASKKAKTQQSDEVVEPSSGKVETVADLAKMTELEVNKLCIKAPKVQVAKKVLTDYASKKAKTQEQSAEVVEHSSEKVEADLAKMTELEVNRLCIKVPKVKVAKKVLTEYASKKAETEEQTAEVVEPNLEIQVIVPEIEKVNIEVQTNEVLSIDSGMQTEHLLTSAVHTQTVSLETSHSSVQTDESGVKSTKDLILSCLKDRPDFIEQLSAQLEESSIQKVASNLSYNAKADLLMKEVTTSNTTELLNRVVEKQCNLDPTNGTVDTSFLQDYLCNRLESKHLISFCSQLLMKLHDKQT